MKKAVFGLTNNTQQADRIVNRLLSSGFTEADISILVADQHGHAKDVTNQNPDLANRHQKGGTLAHEKNTKAPEGATTGAVAGGLIGGSLGLLAGIGALAIPGLGPFIAAGPIVAALSGSGIGGALGLLVGSLVGLGIPEYEAKKYQDALKNGNVLLSVHCSDSNHLDKAKQILKEENAHDIASTTEKAKA